MFLKSQKAFLLALEPLRQISADLSKAKDVRLPETYDPGSLKRNQLPELNGPGPRVPYNSVMYEKPAPGAPRSRIVNSRCLRPASGAFFKEKCLFAIFQTTMM